MKQLLLFAFFLFLCNHFTEAQQSPTFADPPGPEHVLVVYNTQLDTSFMVMNYYKGARQIPNINIVELNLPSDTMITYLGETHQIQLVQQGEIIRDMDNDSTLTPTMHAWLYFNKKIAIPIANYLETHFVNGTALKDIIRFIVLCKGVPFRIDAREETDNSMGQNVICANLLTRLGETIENEDALLYYYDKNIYIPNPYYFIDATFTMDHHFIPNHYDTTINISSQNRNIPLSYLVTHLSAPTFSNIQGMIDRSVNAINEEGYTWFTDLDPTPCYSAPSGNPKPYFDNLGITNYFFEQTEDIYMSYDESPVMSYISNGIWTTLGPNPNLEPCSLYFQEDYIQTLDFNYADGAYFNSIESHNGMSIGTFPVIRTRHQGVIADFTLMGGTVAVGQAFHSPGSHVIRTDMFFPSYAVGYTFAEAAYLGMQYLGATNVIVGDPLTRIASYTTETLSGNTTWNNTVLDKRRVVVPTGSSLTINAGSELVLQTNASLIVEGSLFIQPGAKITLNSYSRIIANDLTLQPNSKLILNDLTAIVIDSSGSLMTFNGSEIRLTDRASLKTYGNVLIGNSSVLNVTDDSYILAKSRFIVTDGSVFNFLGNGNISFDSVLIVNGSINNNVIFNNTTNFIPSLKVNCDTINISNTKFTGDGLHCDLKDGSEDGLILLKDNLFYNTRSGISISGKNETEYHININKNSFQNFNQVGISLDNVPEAIIDSNLFVNIGVEEPISYAGISIGNSGNINISNCVFDLFSASAIKVLTGRDQDSELDYRGDLNISSVEMNGNSFSGTGILIQDNANSIEELNITNCTISSFSNGISLLNGDNSLPRLEFNNVTNYLDKGISIVNTNECLISNNIINLSNNSSYIQSGIGIYISQINNPITIDNVILGNNTFDQGPGIFSLSSNGQIRRNTISEHLNGIELSGSAPDVASNIITGNKEYGIFAGSTSAPNLGNTSFDEEGYPLTGYNNIYENAGCDLQSLSEIYLSGSYIELTKGCNTIADDRQGPLNCDNTLLIDGDHVGDVIYAEQNYWGNHPVYGYDPSERFGEGIEVVYDGFLEEPCTETPGEAYLFISSSDGTVIDTVFGSGSIQHQQSELQQAYSTADKYFFTNNYLSAITTYRGITDLYGTTEQSLKAYSRLYQLYKLTNASKQQFTDLRSYYSSKLSSLSDSSMTLILNHLSDLCLVAEKEYLTAIGNFEDISINNPNTDLAYYSELNALTTSLLAASDSTMGKISGKYAVNGIDDYYERINKLAKNRRENSNQGNVEIPTEYSLYQNYPNPFNPSTIIKFGLPEQTVVELTVFDILGRRVKTLVNNEVRQPGFYEIHFNASDLASGIYFYQLQTNKFTSTKKMMLVK